MNMQKVAPEDFQRQIFQELQELEEQKTEEALELVQRKNKLTKWEGERERARMLQRLESSRAVGQWSGAQIEEADGSCSGHKEHDLVVFVLVSMWPRSGRRALCYGYPRLGQKEHGTGVQKEDYAFHATPELAFVDRGYAVAN